MDLKLNVTLVIIIATGFVSIVAFNKRDVFEKWLYSPYRVFHNKEWYRIFSHAMLHGGWMHLIFNMWILYMFNQDHVNLNYDYTSLGVESSFKSIFGGMGIPFYILLYLGSILAASLPGLIKHRNNPNYQSIGASGAVSAIVFASILLHPTHQMGIIFIPVYPPAFIFGPLYLLMEYFMNKRGGTGIAHDAHIWGAVFGFFFPILLKPGLALDFIHTVTNYIAAYLG